MLFGNATQPLAHICARKFSSKDRKANQQYILVKHKYLSNHSFRQQLLALSDNWDSCSAERLDKDFQRASMHAAKKCSCRPCHIPHVSELSTLRMEKNILLKIISQHALGMNFAAGIAHLCQHGHDLQLPPTIAECKTMCRTIQKQIHDLEKTAVHQRHHEQQQKLAKARRLGYTATAKAIKFCIAAECTKNMYAKIRRFRGNDHCGITRLEVPRDSSDTDNRNCTDWDSVDTPADIEARLLQRNKLHFGQADGTFPTVPPFSEWIDWTASTHTADLVLKGNWQSTEIDELSQCLVDHMAAWTTIDGIDGKISVDEWTQKIQQWPESTTTSPSGFHLSHSKALVSPHNLDTSSPEGELLETQRHELIAWQVQLLNPVYPPNWPKL